MKMLVVAVLVALASCGGAHPKTSDPAAANNSSATPSTAGPSCDDVVDHVKALSIQASGATTDEQKDQAARDVEPALAELHDECEQGWSVTFRGCVMQAKTREDVAECDKANAGGGQPAP